MADKIKNIKGSLILLLAAFIWGTAFVAQTSGADSVGTFTFNTCRSVVGALFLLLVIVLLDSYGKRTSGGGKDTLQEPYSRTKWPVKGGVLCGIILFVAMSLQQYGIGIYPAGVAASGRAGFLTATYVVLVAICSVWMGKKLHPLIAVSIVGCIAGMYLLCMSGGFAGIYMGDVCEFLCAVGFMCHILTVEHFAKEDGIKLSCIQFAVCAILSGVMMLFTENVDFAGICAAGLPILYTGVLSSGIAYTLQIIGQKGMNPTVASILLSMESVFSVLAGWVILGQSLTIKEGLGCVLMFIAIIIAQLPDKKTIQN